MIVGKFDARTMTYEELSTAYLTIFILGNTKRKDTQIHDVEAIILIASKHSFHAHNVHYNYLMDLFLYTLKNEAIKIQLKYKFTFQNY